MEAAKGTNPVNQNSDSTMIFVKFHQDILNSIEATGQITFYAPAYSKNSRRALSVTRVRPVRPSVHLSVCPSVRPTFVCGP